MNFHEDIANGDECMVNIDECIKGTGVDGQEELWPTVNESVRKKDGEKRTEPRPRWADIEDESEKYTSIDSHVATLSTSHDISSVAYTDDESTRIVCNEVAGSVKPLLKYFCFYSRGARVDPFRTERWPKKGDASGRLRASQRLSSGYLEGNRLVPPTCGRNQFAQCVRCRQSQLRPSAGIGRRRSVGCGCTCMHTHSSACTDMQAHVCTGIQAPPMI